MKNNCNYCNIKNERDVVNLDNNQLYGVGLDLARVYNTFMLDVVNSNAVIIEFEINYCPMCGNKLGGENN